MKLFAYDPTTGKRGELLNVVPRSTWASTSVKYCIKHGMMTDMGWIEPASRPGVNHTMHVDAGYFDTSYQREDQWVTFCTGEWKAGQSPAVWEWVILPSKKDLEKAGYNF